MEILKFKSMGISDIEAEFRSLANSSLEVMEMSLPEKSSNSGLLLKGHVV